MNLSVDEQVSDTRLKEIDQILSLRCQFQPAPPRRFLFPAILLLLAETKAHGYHLVRELNELGLTRVNRPAVYRALGELERDGLVEHYEEAPTAGSTRHVYMLTSAGHQVLEAWMSVIAKERADLDTVLKRYWDCNATKVVTLTPEEISAFENGDSANSASADTVSREKFIVASDRSRLVIEVRTNIGPIAFSNNNLKGWVIADICGNELRGESSSEAEIEVNIEDFVSGNPIYDRELSRRIDAQKFPTARLRLLEARRIGNGNCYRVCGGLTIHGVSVGLQGKVTAMMLDPSNSNVIEKPGLCVTGEQTIDIRLFNLQPPQMPIFKFYPDVILSLQLEADRVATS